MFHSTRNHVSAPSAATCSCHRWCRATSVVPQPNNAHPERRRVLQVSGSCATGVRIGRPGGACRPAGRSSCSSKPQSECARGPEQKCRALRSRPQGLRDRARHQPRSALRGVAGCPRRRGSRRQRSGSGSGEGFPLLQRKDRSVPTLLRRNRPLGQAGYQAPKVPDRRRQRVHRLRRASLWSAAVPPRSLAAAAVLPR